MIKLAQRNFKMFAELEGEIPNYLALRGRACIKPSAIARQPPLSLALCAAADQVLGLLRRPAVSITS